MKFTENTSVAARKAEVEIKLARVRELIDRESLSGVLLMKHSNFSWITAGGRSYVTLYLEHGEAFVLITRDKQYVLTSIIEHQRLKDEEQVEQLGFEVVYQNWYESRTAEMVKELAGDLGNIGTDMFFAGAKLMNDKINPLHFSLLDGEIARYRHLGDTLSAVLEEYILTVRPGMTEYEITGGLAQALWNKGIEQVLYMVSADERAYHYRHGIPTENVVLKNHLNISVNGRYKGLITTVTRMVHFGKRDKDLIKQFDDTCEIECRCAAAIKIGQDDLAAYNACKSAYEELGYGDMWPLHGQGGAQSYNNRDYMVTEGSHRVTVENQGYCFNPVIDGTKAEDAFIATKSGPLFITNPVTFPVVEKEFGGYHFRLPGLQFID